MNGPRVIKGAAWLSTAAVVALAVAVTISVRRDIDSVTDVGEALALVSALVLGAVVLAVAATLIGLRRTEAVGRVVMLVLVCPALFATPLVSAVLGLAMVDRFRDDWYAYGGFRVLGVIGLVATLFAAAVWAGVSLLRGRGWQSGSWGRRSPEPPAPDGTAAASGSAATTMPLRNALLRVPMSIAASSLVAAAILMGAGLFAFIPFWALEEIVAGTAESNARAAARARAPYPVADGEALLRRLSRSVPAVAEVAARPCPDAQIAATAGPGEKASWFGTLVLVTQAFDPSVTSHAPVGPRDAGDDVWRWANSLAVSQVLESANAAAPAEDYDRRLQAIARRRYLAWVKAAQLVRPRPIRAGEEIADGARRRLASGTHFSPGVVHGGLFVLDIRAAAVVCQVPLDVTSSPTVEHVARGAFAAAPQTALDDDFRARFRDGERAALRRVSSVLRVER